MVQNLHIWISFVHTYRALNMIVHDSVQLIERLLPYYGNKTNSIAHPC